MDVTGEVLYARPDEIPAAATEAVPTAVDDFQRAADELEGTDKPLRIASVTNDCTSHKITVEGTGAKAARN